MFKYFNINPDIFSDEEIIQRLEMFFRAHGTIHFKHAEKIQLSNDYCENELFDIWGISERGLWGNYTLESGYMFEIGYCVLNRDELIQICEICKKYINGK